MRNEFDYFTAMDDLAPGAAVDAELELRRRFLQDRAELNEARARSLRAQRVKRGGVVSAAEQALAALARRCADEQLAREGGKLAEHCADVLAAVVELAEQRERAARVARQDEGHELRGLHVSGKTQRIKHRGRVDRAADGGTLIQKRQRIAQRPVGKAG